MYGEHQVIDLSSSGKVQLLGRLQHVEGSVSIFLFHVFLVGSEVNVLFF